MRHSFATLLLQQGVPISYVSEQLGHESIETTLRWYWWALPRGEVGYLDELDHVIGSATKPQPNLPQNAVAKSAIVEGLIRILAFGRSLKY